MFKYYLSVRFAIGLVLIFLIEVGKYGGPGHDWYKFYFSLFWALYLFSAVSIYVAAWQFLSKRLLAYGQISRLVRLIIWWIGAVSTVAVISNWLSLRQTGYVNVNRTIAFVELCLLIATLKLFRAERRSYSDPLFAIFLGFALHSAAELAMGFLVSQNTLLTGFLNLGYQIVTDVVLLLWIGYFLFGRPKPPAGSGLPGVNPRLAEWDRQLLALMRAHGRATPKLT